MAQPHLREGRQPPLLRWGSHHFVVLDESIVYTMLQPDSLRIRHIGYQERNTTMARCGTISGYKGHQDHDEKPCDACARAKRLYDERRREAPDQQVKSRDSAAAQYRARKRLKDAHPEEYARYYAEETKR